MVNKLLKNMPSKKENTLMIKDLKKEVAYHLESSLGKLKELWGEKKFNNRVKKAVTVLMEGIEKSNTAAPKKAPSQNKQTSSKEKEISKTSKATDKTNAKPIVNKQKTGSKIIMKTRPTKSNT